MLKNVFYKSVQSQHRNMHFFSLWINIKRCIQIILEADLLDVQIILHMFQLFREDDHAVGAFEKVAEILHQGSGKIHDQLRAATQPKTVDQVQAVQKEMRLDLQGQVLKFGVSLVQLLFVDLQLQVVDLPDHIVKGFRQLCKFIMSIRINGTYACENFDLLTSVPRGEWGFDGMVMTDWGAGNRAGVDTMMHAGNDLVMPGRTQDRMIAALQGNPVGTTADPNLDKTLVRGDIQKCVSRVLTMIMRSSQFGKMNSKVDVKAHTETYDNLVTYSSVKKEEVKTTAVKKLEDELKKAQEKADKLEKELGEANQKTQAANKEVEKLQAKLDVRTKNIRLKSAKSKKAKQATIRWAKVKNVDGYVVEYSTKANMKSAKKKNVKASTISLTVKNLKKGKKYYVRVRGYKVIDGQKVYTQYSAKKAVKIKK